MNGCWRLIPDFGPAASSPRSTNTVSYSAGIVTEMFQMFSTDSSDLVLEGAARHHVDQTNIRPQTRHIIENEIGKTGQAPYRMNIMPIPHHQPDIRMCVRGNVTAPK